MDKKKLLVSFSGGETSAFMAFYLWTKKRDEFEMVFVFANTGQENEETLEFVEACQKHWGFPLYWIEGMHFKEYGKGAGFKLVDFDSASRNGEPFESYVSVYGLPNTANPQCTRELKGAPIKAFARDFLKWTGYYTAIGIRADEVDRISKDARNKRFLYPLISMIPTTKLEINTFWDSMYFRLKLKGYQGNCKWCWKKSKNKLLKLAQENPAIFEFPNYLEETYGNFFPEQRIKKYLEEGKTIPKNIKMFRGHLSAADVLREASTLPPIEIVDDSARINPNLYITIDPENLDLVGGDSCEVWAECKNEDDI